jgi:RNA polymerase primary sigma factor
MKNIKISKTYTSRDQLSLGLYFQDIGKMSTISAEEEEKLAKKIKQGDKQAMEMLVRANLRFVVSVAKQYQHRGLSLPDLISEGNIGLIKAAWRFDETRGFKFISYAVWWIRQSILQALSDQVRTVRVPLNKLRMSVEIKKSTARFEQDHQREPGVDELALELNMTPAEVTEALSSNDYTSSLDQPLGEESDHLSMLDMLEDENIPHTDDQLMKDSDRVMIERALSILEPRERNILRKYYGLDSRFESSLEQIAQEINLSRERVRRVKQAALRKLKASHLENFFQSTLETA